MACSLEMHMICSELPVIEQEVSAYLKRKRFGHVDDDEFFHLSRSTWNIDSNEDEGDAWSDWLPSDGKIKKKDVRLDWLPSDRKIRENDAWPDWLPTDWKIRKKQRNNGKTKGVVDKVYISPCNEKFRSKVQAIKFLELQKELLQKNKV